MKKFIVIWMTAVMLLWPIGIHAETAKVSSDDLIEHSKELDGQTVIYTGEAVGTILKRDGYAWVNLNDGSNAIGIVISNEMVDSIHHMGRYGQIGDQVEVVGTFHRACAEHGGDMDIHTDTIRVVKDGASAPEKLNTDYLIWSVILAIGAVSFAFIVYRKTSMIYMQKRTNI